MDLSGLRDAFRTEVTANADVNTFVMDDTFNINANHANNYPVIWMPIPNSRLVRGGKEGMEVFVCPFTIYDLQGSLDIDAQIDRLSELKLIAMQVFRDMPKTYTDIVDYQLTVEIARGNRLHNDRLLGIGVQLELTVWTGWNCL